MENIKPETRICRGPLCEGIEKPVTDFSPKSRLCKKCNCHNIKEYYKKNDRPYRKFKNEIKENSKCIECGITDIRVLEFDHNKGVKNINICKSFSREKIKSELEHTQVLCTWCHRLKTRKDLDEKMEISYTKYTIVDRPQDTIKGKHCIGPLCNSQLQFIELFPKTKKTYCNACVSYRAYLIRQQNRTFLRDLKLSAKECQLCKKEVTADNATCFDYDHINQTDKVTTLSILVRLNVDKRVEMLEESKKCRLLCCNCHRIHTAHQLNYKMTETIDKPDT